MDLLRQRILGDRLGEHLGGLVAQRLDDRVRQRPCHHLLVADQILHRVGVRLLAPGLADHVAGCRGSLDDRLEILRQLLPGGLVDQQLRHCGRFMPAGGVVELRGLVQTEAPILEGSDELRRVDHTPLERREDLAAGQHLHVDPEVRVDAAGQPRDAHLQALQIGHRIDFLLEPAGHLHAGVATGQGDHAEGHGREVLGGKGLAGPEVAVRVVHLDGTGAHRIEALERGHQLARAEDLDVETPVGHVANAARQIGRAAGAVHVEGRALHIGAGHLPVETSLRADDGRRRDGAQRAGSRSSTGQETTTTNLGHGEHSWEDG